MKALMISIKEEAHIKDGLVNVDLPKDDFNKRRTF